MPSPRRLRRKKIPRTSHPSPRGQHRSPLWWMPITAIAIVIITALAIKQEPSQHDLTHSPHSVQARHSPPLGHPSLTISGRATVVDGDTLIVAGTRIRLFGIDAPESNQHCQLGSRPWACGAASTAQLRNLIGDSAIRCAPTSNDRYGRTLARCHVHETDIQAWMVANGWAVAYSRYSHDYEPEQKYAQHLRLGIWQGRMILPEDWRYSTQRR